MGVQRPYRVTCDVKGCPKHGPTAATEACAAYLAELAGWQVAGDVAICPGHTEAGEFPEVAFTTVEQVEQADQMQAYFGMGE